MDAVGAGDNLEVQARVLTTQTRIASLTDQPLEGLSDGKAVVQWGCRCGTQYQVVGRRKVQKMSWRSKAAWHCMQTAAEESHI